MADTLTAHYSWVKPEVGASATTWGNKLNTDLDGIDNQVFIANTRASACLPKDGSEAFTGNMSIGGTLSVTGTQTFTGAATFVAAVTAAVAPTLGNHLTNKTYVDAQTALKLNKAGDTMTGLLVLSADPSAALGAATKQYVDAVSAKTVSAGTGLTGGGAISSNPTISVAAGGIGTTQLADNAVATAKIPNAAVTNAKLAQPFTQMTEQTASGTSVLFSNIPSWARKITITFDGVINGSTGSPMFQIGPSGGVETTGYVPYIYIVQGGSASTNVTGFVMPTSGTATLHGHIVLTNPTGNEWIMSMMLAIQGSNNIIGGGKKVLAGALDRILFKHLNGADSFGGGTFSVQYE